MSTILDKIVAHKRKEVAQNKEQNPVHQLEKSNYFSRICHSLEDRLKNQTASGIIAEFKRKSPSKNNINDHSDIEEVTQAYTKLGASGLSILTDHHFFGGKNHDIEKARRINPIPILRKDFIIDEYQIIEAKAIGADVILLITECLSKEEVVQFTKSAKDLGMEVLLELHSKKQLDKVGPDNTLIGINNRDLTTFKVDIDRSIELAEELPKDSVKIAESGINDAAVIDYMRKADFDGFLIGEHFMKEADPGEAFRNFVNQISQA